jgi:hypothetical protein
MLSNRALRAGAGGRAARTRASAFGRNPPSAPDEPKAARGGPWLEALLSRFGPTTDRAQNLTTLDFEKPLLELDKRIKEVGSPGRGRARGGAFRRYRAETPPLPFFPPSLKNACQLIALFPARLPSQPLPPLTPLSRAGPQGR